MKSVNLVIEKRGFGLEGQWQSEEVMGRKGEERGRPTDQGQEFSLVRE